VCAWSCRQRVTGCSILSASYGKDEDEYDARTTGNKLTETGAVGEAKAETKAKTKRTPTNKRPWRDQRAREKARRPGQSGPRTVSEKEQFHDRGTRPDNYGHFQARPDGVNLGERYSTRTCKYPSQQVPRHVSGSPIDRDQRQGLANLASCHPPSQLV
jgi:hypothetical protein